MAGSASRNASPAELKALEPMQFVLDLALQLPARALRGGTDPIPFLQQQFSVLPVGLEIERGHDSVPDQNRQREIAEAPLLLRHIGFEKMLITEDQLRPLALD